MRRLILFTTLAAAVLAGPPSAGAQSDILLRLRAGAPAGDRFRVDSAGGVLAKGVLGVGIIPGSGAGERMMWYPNKAAFRAGGVGPSPGTQWDDANVGFYSWAGGSQTTASGVYSFAMGSTATASGLASVALGSSVTAGGQGSVAMGSSATASGQGSVALGENVTANANYAVALGQRASAGGFAGTFTWADGSTSTTFSATAANSFQIRASGGVRLLTNSAATVGMSLNAGGSSWNTVSDRNRKRDFAEVDGEDVLARIRNLPVTTWAYIDEAGSVRHMGPMAQDWHAAFGFSADDTTINMSDLDGVNLAAVQALERRTADLQAQLADRDARIRTLEENAVRVRSLEERVAQLEALIAAQQAPADRP